MLRRRMGAIVCQGDEAEKKQEIPSVCGIMEYVQVHRPSVLIFHQKVAEY